MKSELHEVSELTYDIVDQMATLTGFNTPKHTTIMIPTMIGDAKVVAIEPKAFEGFPFIENYEVEGDSTHFKSVDGVLFSKDGTRLISYPQGRKSIYYEMPEGVVSVEALAFARAKKLKNVELRDVKFLKNSAFKFCTSLEEVSIGQGFLELQPFSFGFCTKLTGIEFPSCELISDWAFAATFQLKSLYFHNEIPSRLGLHAFSDMNADTVIAFNSGGMFFFPSELGPEYVASNLKEESI